MDQEIWENIRLNAFPSLHYANLFEWVLKMIEIVPFVQQGQNGK